MGQLPGSYRAALGARAAHWRGGKEIFSGALPRVLGCARAARRASRHALPPPPAPAHPPPQTWEDGLLVSRVQRITRPPRARFMKAG